MLRKMCLPLPVITQILEGLRADHMLEVMGHSGPFGYNYTSTNRGREHTQRLLEISGYIGPTPVSLEDYISGLEFQFHHMPPVRPDEIEEAVARMVLPEQAQHIGGLAIMSRRSLFLYGPPGNGKTTLGHLLHDAVRGNIWVPYAIGVENLKKPQIQKELQKLNKRRFQKALGGGDQVIEEFKKIAFSDIQDYMQVNESGFITAKQFDEMKNTGVIAGMKEIIGKDGRRVEFKLWDKNKALESLAKHFNLFKDNDAGTTINIPEGMTIKFVKSKSDS